MTNGGSGAVRLRLVGYWDGPMAGGGWPDVRGFVDGEWDREERRDVVDYLGQGFVFRGFGGISRCRFCGVENGALELTDGVWYWPDGLAHYLVEHEVRLPRVFVEHVLAAMGRLEDAETDTAWWKGQRGR